MRCFELGEVLAERSLVFEAEAGWSKNVQIRLGRPVLDSSAPGTSWICPFQILGLERDSVKGIFGIDAMQALILAIHTIPVELSSFARETPGKFVWRGRAEATFLFACRTALKYSSDTLPDED